MNINKVKVESYLKYNTVVSYGIRAYFNDGHNKNYTIDERLKYQSNVQKGKGFAKIQKFLNTQEGLQWIYDYISNQERNM